MIQENLVDLINGSISKNWDLPALSNYEGETLTYKDVGEKILWLHYILQENNIKKNDKIALVGKNCVNWAITYMAAITYGAVIVPLLPDFHAKDMEHLVNHSDALFLFVAEDIIDKIDEKALKNIEAIFSLDNFKVLWAKKKDHFEKTIEGAENKYLMNYDNDLTKEKFSLKSIANTELASIVYTSVTTGFSKGVMLPHNSLSSNVNFAQNNLALEAGDPILSFLPMAHVFGCTFEFLYPIVVGCHITFLNRAPAPNVILKAFGEIKPKLILWNERMRPLDQLHEMAKL